MGEETLIQIFKKKIKNKTLKEKLNFFSRIRPLLPENPNNFVNIFEVTKFFNDKDLKNLFTEYRNLSEENQIGELGIIIYIRIVISVIFL